MRFQTKILLVTLSILILTLVMNSVLSLASFEKVYVKSSVSTYELICKDLKRKIERSLRFGKPLEKFENMDKLLKETLDQNRDIDSISVCDMKGGVLYRAGGNPVDELSVELPRLDKEATVKTVLQNRFYHSFADISDRTQTRVGLINLTFPRRIIYDKLKSMVGRNIDLLWVLMLLTSLCLVLLLAMVIMRPINSQVRGMMKILDPDGPPPESGTPEKMRSGRIHRHYLKENVPDTMDEDVISNYLQLGMVRNEIDRLGVHIEAFANSFASSMDRLDILHSRQEAFSQACGQFRSACGLYRDALSGATAELSKEDKDRLEGLLLSVNHLGELLEMMVLMTDLRPDLEKDTKSICMDASEKDGL